MCVIPNSQLPGCEHNLNYHLAWFLLMLNMYCQGHVLFTQRNRKQDHLCVSSAGWRLWMIKMIPVFTPFSVISGSRGFGTVSFQMITKLEYNMKWKSASLSLLHDWLIILVQFHETIYHRRDSDSGSGATLKLWNPKRKCNIEQMPIHYTALYMLLKLFTQSIGEEEEREE